MRATMRMLASVKSERFLEAGNPTGLTGLFTHPNPRSTLLYLYGTTLEKLKAIPEHSVYRQSTEALTKHRYNIVNSFKPPGYAEWTQRMHERLDKLEKAQDQGLDQNQKTNPPIILGEKVGEYVYGSIEQHEEKDERLIEWDGEEDNLRRSARSTGAVSQSSQQQGTSSNLEEMKWEAEPPLEALQIVEIENQIGGGLIEEVIKVAEGEWKLADEMVGSKVWEELEEKAPQGQWEYFARDQHTPGTQEPPNK